MLWEYSLLGRLANDPLPAGSPFLLGPLLLTKLFLPAGFLAAAAATEEEEAGADRPLGVGGGLYWSLTKKKPSVLWRWG